ncbi:MAG: hypothetical protein ACRCY8_17495, partial [Dermatophilaceae bacterium]
LLALQQTPPGRNELLDTLLGKENWRERPDLALHLFEHRIRPILVPGFDPIMLAEVDRSEASKPPGFGVDLTGDEYALARAWREVFFPMFDSHAQAILDVVTTQLRAVYRLVRSTRPDACADPISFHRSAIEEHEQNAYRESMDVLIDAARDCLERLLDTDVPAAAAHLDAWASADEALFRRLAVHGWRLRTDRSATEKLRWVREQNLIYEFHVKHEVYLLLQHVIPHASDDDVQALLDRALGIPPGDTDDDPSPYERYNLLVWLNRITPENRPVAEAFRDCQAAHPEYEPRDHPDLDMVMTGGVAEDAAPFTIEELHEKVERDPGTTLAEIRQFQSVDPWTFTEPTWRGALRLVKAVVAQHPADGLALADLLGEDDGQLRAALIDGWSEAELDEDQVRAVIAAIGAWDADEVRRAAARMFADDVHPDHPTAWHRYPEARDLAAALWPQDEVSGAVTPGVDFFFEAINHPCGDLAHFWSKAVEAEWRQNQDTWSGIPAVLTSQLDVMVQAGGRNGLMARTILGSYLRFYMATDPEWTRNHLLTLFDWSRHPSDAPGVWQGFLHRGVPDDGLLEAGQLTRYLETCKHTEQLARPYLWRLADHLAFVAMFATNSPRPWLGEFISEASEPLREAWAGQVAHRLSNLTAEEASHQWNRWIHEYWEGRARSVPLPPTAAEASAVAEWVLALPNERRAAVDLTRQSPAGLTSQGVPLSRLADEDLAADAATWTDLITHLLSNTESDYGTRHFLPQIVGKLKAAEPPPDLAALREEAMRLGCTNASEW